MKRNTQNVFFLSSQTRELNNRSSRQCFPLRMAKNLKMFFNQFSFLILGGRTIWLPIHFKDEENQPQRVKRLAEITHLLPAGRAAIICQRLPSGRRNGRHVHELPPSVFTSAPREHCSLDPNMFLLHFNTSNIDQFCNQRYPFHCQRYFCLSCT